MERAVLAAVPFLLVGLALSLPLLLMPGPVTITMVIVHLAGLVVLGLVAAWRLAPLAGGDWFLGSGWSSFWRLAASGVAVVFLVTGMVGLVTLASSAALRFPPSMQFLQLLSALDIAWAGTALIVGTWRLWGGRAAIVAAVVLGFLDAVGIGPSGEWIVDAAALNRHVLPFDVIAAVAAVVMFVLGTRRAAQAMEQASPQS
jgi:hypothetical protein